MLEQLNPPDHNVYNPPDVYNPTFDPPDDAVDVLSMVERGPPFCPMVAPSYLHQYYEEDNVNGAESRTRRKIATNDDIDDGSTIKPGKGAQLDHRGGYCDGTIESFCSRGPGQKCLLRHHNDGRGGILFNGYSGWLIMDVPQVELGMIIVKMETWRQDGAMSRTNGWTSENNEKLNEDTTIDGVSSSSEAPGGERRNLLVTQPFRKSDEYAETDNMHEHGFDPTNEEEEDGLFNYTDSADDYDHQFDDFFEEREEERLLKKKKKKPVVYCDDFRFEYALDGVITSLNITEFNKREQLVGQNNQVITLSYGDFNLTTTTSTSTTSSSTTIRDKPASRTVRVALRRFGCGETHPFKLTHVYWA